MKSITQLDAKFAWSIVVRSCKRIIQSGEKEAVRDIQGCSSQRDVLPDFFSDGHIDRRVMRHVVRLRQAVTSDETRTENNCIGYPKPVRQVQFGPCSQCDSLIVVQKEEAIWRRLEIRQPSCDVAGALRGFV